MSKKLQRKRVARQPKTDTVESLMETRFDRLESKLDSFKDEINTWKHEFVKQLTKLNTNMETVLEQIADHEGRLTKLEQDKAASSGYKQGVNEGKKFLLIIAKVCVAVGAIIGSVGGCGWILKFLSVI